MNRLFYSFSIVHIIIVCSCTHRTPKALALRRVHTCVYTAIIVILCIERFTNSNNDSNNWKWTVQLNAMRNKAKQSADVQWHDTKNKRQLLEATEKKKCCGCECVCDFSCDWHDDQTSSMDMWWFNLQWHTHRHTHTQHVQPFKLKRKKTRTNEHCFVLTVISHCHWCQSVVPKQQQQEQKNMKN